MHVGTPASRDALANKASRNKLRLLKIYFLGPSLALGCGFNVLKSKCPVACAGDRVHSSIIQWGGPFQRSKVTATGPPTRRTQLKTFKGLGLNF